MSKEDAFQRETVQQTIRSFQNLNNLPYAVIVDLDGTLALNDHRSFTDYDKVGEDKVNTALLLILQGLLCIHNDIQLLAITGRPFECRNNTVAWLTSVIKIDNVTLHTRDKDDRRCDTEIKQEIYQKHIKGRYHVLCVFEDRKRNLAMWKEEGLYIFDCSQDPFAQYVF